jgi:hypothetical protein
MLHPLHTLSLPRVTMLRAIGALLAISATVSSVVSCSLVAPDECPKSTARCNGNVPARCEQDCYEPGCGLTWQSYGDCGDQRCVSVGDGVTFCAASSVPDPKCRAQDVGGYCDGLVAVSCRAGYAESRSDCAAVEQVDSGSSPGTPTCVLKTLKGDPICTTTANWCGLGEATCSAPTECGSIAGSFANADDAPVPAGGTVQDGLYFLTEINEYLGHGVSSPARTIAVQATRRIQNGILASSVYGEMDPGQSSGPFTLEGANLIWAISCPSPGTTTFGFTATGSTLKLYETRGSIVYEFVHQRQ